MGLQLIFVVETNKKCKSDWIYVKDTLERFYQYDQAQTKFSPVYMDGKGKYSQKGKEAAAFKAKKLIADVDVENLSAKSYRSNTSNFMRVLDRYLTRNQQP